MIKTPKIRASAMQFAILVTVIIALLLSSFLLFTYTYSSFSSRSEELIKNIEISDSGIRYLFENSNVYSDSLEISIGDLPVKLKSSYWGSFLKVSSEVLSESNPFKKMALLGASSTGSIASIYLEDNQMPLVLAGNTRIEGEAYIPEDFVKPGSVGGHYYQGDQLIYGVRHASGPRLPSLDASWRTYTRGMLNFMPEENHEVVKQSNLKKSFFSHPTIIYQDNKIFLSESLTGNIIIKSEEEIEVEPWAKLDQVLLVAPKVVISKGFSGNLHVIAEKIIVEEGVILNYPSSLVVFEKEYPEAQTYFFEPKIELGKNVLFQGNILYLNTKDNDSSKKDMVLEENSLVEGSIYCEGYAEIKGTVKGTIYAKFFSANHNGSMYINHIFNGRVVTARVRKKMCGILLEGRQKQVAAWLY